MAFSRKKTWNVLSVKKKVIPLHRNWQRDLFGRLAQLVQSICLTSRGSAVRIRQRPRRIPPRCGIFCFYTLLFLYAGVLPKAYLRCFRKLQENFGFFSFVHRILWLGVLRRFLYTFELCWEPAGGVWKMLRKRAVVAAESTARWGCIVLLDTGQSCGRFWSIVKGIDYAWIYFTLFCLYLLIHFTRY